MKNQQFNLVRAMATAILLTTAAQTVFAGAGNNWNHEIQVYSIEDYGDQTDYNSKKTDNWKTNVDITNARNPYNDFWSVMYTNCDGSSVCAHSSSMRRRDSAVTVDAMCNDGEDDFEDADMVFFWGHVAHAPGNPYDFDVWTPVKSGSTLNGWTKGIIDYDEWGTSDAPYYYSWPEIVTDATSTDPYAIFYAYKPMTSILIGDDYTSGTWYTNNTYSGTQKSHSGKLGGDLKWFIAHGCSGLPVAVPQNISTGANPVSQSKGAKIWGKVWDGIHVVMGHYFKSTTTSVPDLNVFANDIKNGVPIKQAYFDSHEAYVTDNNAWSQPAALTAASKTECCSEYKPGSWTCRPSCLMKYFTEETWNNVLPDPTGTLIYTSAWNVDI